MRDDLLAYVLHLLFCSCALFYPWPRAMASIHAIDVFSSESSMQRWFGVLAGQWRTSKGVKAQHRTHTDVFGHFFQ